MIGFGAQRLMELESDGLCGAAHGERSAERVNQRNGYRERDWQTRAGTVELVGRSASNPEAPPRRLFPWFPGLNACVQPQDRREGADGGDPGGLCPGHLDPL